MGFLSPLLLLLGAAVVVPILLHLYHRQHGPRVVFPALRYLRRAEKESARRIRLRQILLLALRVAAIVFIALAAARPFLHQGGSAHAPTAVAIVLDNSLSTGLVQEDRRVLDVLERRALETLANAGPDDRFWVIRAGSPWEPAVPGDAGAAAARVRATDVSAGAADLGAALGRARALLAAGAEGRATEIQLLSDLQATDFRTPLAAAPGAPPLVVWSPGTEVPANAGITAVSVGGGLAPRADARSTMTAELGGVRKDSVSVRLTLDGRMVAADNAAVGSAAVLPFPARPAGLASGWVSIDPDALRGDDRRYFVVRVEPPPTVAITGTVPFADQAVGVLADAGRVRRGAAGTADILLAPAGAGIPGATAGHTVVVLAPASPLELPAVNGRLATAGIPWRYGPPAAGGEARFAVADSADPLERALEHERIRQVYPLQRQGAAGDTVLLRLSDGSPWAVRGTLPSGGRFILLASPLTPDATTIPTSSAMLPLLDHVTGVWAAAQPASTEVLPGEQVQLAASANAVQRPDGALDRVDGGAYTAPGQAGIYRVLAGSNAVGAFAVNPPAEESDLTRLSTRRLKQELPRWDVETADDAAEWARTIYQRRLGHEAWRPLALLLLSVLLLEGLVATSGRGRAASPHPAGVPARPEPAGRTPASAEGR